MYFGFYPNGLLYNPNALTQFPPSNSFPSMPPPQIPGGPGPYPVPGGYQVPGRMPTVPGGISPTQGNGAPTSPPPQYKPQKPQTAEGFVYMIDPVVMQPCLYRYTYIWLNDGNEFWYYPVVMGASSVGGYIWNGTWLYYALDLNRIVSASCP